MNEYEAGEFDMFRMISAAWYGKEAYCLQNDLGPGSVYSRISERYMTIDEAYKEFLRCIQADAFGR